MAGHNQHGLPMSLYPFTENPQGGYLAFLGRISPEKRPDRAIAIAKRVGMPLKIAAKIDNADRAYFREEIKPLLADPMIEFVGEIDDAGKGAFLGNAAALLFPIDWPEPFGLVMIEAMACGTPVIAWPCGSVPEGSTMATGRIVNCEDGCAAVAEVTAFDRRRIRKSSNADSLLSYGLVILSVPACYRATMPSSHGLIMELTASAFHTLQGYDSFIVADAMEHRRCKRRLLP